MQLQHATCYNLGGDAGEWESESQDHMMRVFPACLRCPDVTDALVLGGQSR